MTDKTHTALDHLLDQVPVGQAPIGDLLTAGHTMKRRQRRTLISGVVAATMFVLGGGFIAAQALSGGDGSGNTNQSNLTADRTVAEGTHLVGIGQVTVAVPDTWKANDAFCNKPLGDTYFFPYPQDCIGVDSPMEDEAGSTSVAITTRELTETGTRINGLKPEGEIGGHEIVGSGAGCFESNPPICTEVFGVPDLKAYFTVRTDAPGGEQTMVNIRNSLTLLEPDVTTVPFVPMSTQAEVVAGCSGRRGAVNQGRNVDLPRHPLLLRWRHRCEPRCRQRRPHRQHRHRHSRSALTPLALLPKSGTAASQRRFIYASCGPANLRCSLASRMPLAWRTFPYRRHVFNRCERAVVSGGDLDYQHGLLGRDVCASLVEPHLTALILSGLRRDEKPTPRPQGSTWRPRVDPS